MSPEQHLKDQGIPHCLSVSNGNRLVWYREVIAIQYENRTKHISKVCEQSSDIFNVEENLI
jgi:hypothetical protein